MLTAIPQSPVSFLKCLAERELHGLPDLPRGLTCVVSLLHSGSRNKEHEVKRLFTFMRIRPTGKD